MNTSCLIPALLITSIALGAAATDSRAAGPGVRVVDAAVAERALVAEINAVRARHQLKPLRRVVALSRPARAHSRALVARGAFTHDSAEGSPFHARLVAAGVPRRWAMAENIAEVPGCGRGAGRAALRMWMASPPHRANILNRRMRVVGVGFAARRACASTVVTADFGG